MIKRKKNLCEDLKPQHTAAITTDKIGNSTAPPRPEKIPVPKKMQKTPTRRGRCCPVPAAHGRSSPSPGRIAVLVLALPELVRVRRVPVGGPQRSAVGSPCV